MPDDAWRWIVFAASLGLVCASLAAWVATWRLDE
jgi:hypothetical protein